MSEFQKFSNRRVYKYIAWVIRYVQCLKEKVQSKISGSELTDVTRQRQDPIPLNHEQVENAEKVKSYRGLLIEMR